jgi:hypothetical protein
MGFAHNVEPSYMIPTCIGVNDAVLIDDTLNSEP